jgi:hypothetical protein
MSSYFQCRDTNNVIVICDKDIWKNHIVSEHPEMSGQESCVQATITLPYQIYQDTRHTNRKNYYRPFVLPAPFNMLYLRVGIEYKNSKFRGYRGFVLTAFSCPGIRKGDILIWQLT